MEILVLGELEVLGRSFRAGPSDLGGRKPKQLLELLALARGQPVSKDALVDQLWTERRPRRPVAALENHIWVLRRHLGDAGAADGPFVVAESGTYRLAVQRLTLDLVRFDDLLQAAHGAAPAEARKHLTSALALVRGDLVADEPYADWAAPLREAYRVRVSSLQLDLAEAALVDDDAEDAVEHAGRVLDGEPLNERACRLTMLGLARRGERVRALRIFESFRATLRRELEIEPLTETRAVYEELRAGAVGPSPPRVPDRGPTTGAVAPAPAVLVIPPAAAPATDPEPTFIGRDGELRSLGEEIQRTSEGRFRLALVEGLAHTGKTGLVREALARCPPVLQGWARFAIPPRGLPYLLLFAALGDAIGSVELLAQADHATPGELLRRELRRHAPLVLVLDDLHHADVHAIRALSYLQLSCADVPVTVVGIFRSEEVGYDHPLRSLSPTSHLRLATVTIEDLGPIGGGAAHARTGGYGAYLPSWLAGQRTGPPADELLAAVLGRCQAAGTRGHRILTVAAALPEPLAPTAVAAAIGLGVHQVAEHLDRLTARGLLCDHGPWGYAFSASLVADALRTQVSRPRRELLVASAGTAPAASAGAERLAFVPRRRADDV
jgi:DNA-binding SARP family transcriptional activator